MSQLYKIIGIILILLCSYLVFKNVTLEKKNKELQEVAVKNSLVVIEEKHRMIDSLTAVKLVITKELISNAANIKKAQEYLKTIKVDSLSLDDAKKILGL